jgi:hypothetical protein
MTAKFDANGTRSQVSPGGSAWWTDSSVKQLASRFAGRVKRIPETMEI